MLEFSRINAAAAAMAAALLLGGCGGGPGAGKSAGAPTGPPAAAGDSFTQQVLAIATSSSDETEPLPVDIVTATQPEDAQPVALQGP